MKNPVRFPIFALISTFVLWVIYFLVVRCASQGDWVKSGQFGDSFGALNTLFTGWAFVVVLATLYQQSKQIAETKSDVEKEHKLQEQTMEFVKDQAEALASVARLNALTARIEAYHVQIEDVKASKNFHLVEKLVAERRDLLLKLDEVLKLNGDR